MKEGLNLEGAKLLWKTRLEQRKPDVERELYRVLNGPQIPYVSESCPEKYKELAERLVELQVELGEYRREDIETSDMYKIKDISKAEGISFRDVIAMLVKNDAYLNYEIIDARHIIQLLAEFDAAYEKFYDKYQAFPLNVLSPESRRYLKNNKNGMTIIEKLQTILEVYRPELSNIKIDEYNYDALPKSRVVLGEEEIQKIVAEISSIAKDGNIDVIFSKKYEAYFKDLCSKLKLAGYTFDRFINEYTKFKYTLCFKADIIPAVRQMVYHYYEKYGSTKGMTTNDPYLRYKVESAQNAAGLFTSRDLFESFGIVCDSPDKTARTILIDELKERDDKLFAKLNKLYPDKVIQKGFATKHERDYDELCLLAKRLGFSNIDEYLASHGYSRVIDKKASESVIYLSERDLMRYGFIFGCTNAEQMQQRLDELGIAYVGPYENLGIYRRLAFEGLDSTYDPNAPRNVSEKK